MKSGLYIDTSTLLALQGVQQHYCRGTQIVPVLDTVDLKLGHGQTCAISGESGSGKSTLLAIMGMLERPVQGRVEFAGQDMMAASSDELARIRNRHIGFVFQDFNLLPRLSAVANVALPLAYRGMPHCEAYARAHHVLAQVGLADRALHRPSELSGGQRQRVAIARALVGEPQLILADEPTGNLDADSAERIMALLLSRERTCNATLVMVTHDPLLAQRFERRFRVVNHTLVEEPLHA